MNNRASREGTIKSIQDAVANMFNLSVEDLKRESRSREIAMPRKIAIYLAKLSTDASLSEIGREFGSKHPTTVMHSLAKIHQVRATDPGMNTLIEALLAKLRAPAT
jgi:chromosomal replication initiator protein